jgi:hypothetical protein
MSHRLPEEKNEHYSCKCLLDKTLKVCMNIGITIRTLVKSSFIRFYTGQISIMRVFDLL